MQNLFLKPVLVLFASSAPSASLAAQNRSPITIITISN